MSRITYTQDPQAVKDYVIDLKGLSHGRSGALTDYLETGETIASYAVAVPDGINVSEDSEVDGAISFWVSGGTVGVSYDVVCHFVTNQGREDDVTVSFYIADQ